MGFVFKEYFIEKETKLFLFLMRELNISQAHAQKMIDTNKVFQNGNVINKKSAVVKGKIEVLQFEPDAKGLKPIFETKNFAIFDKPSGVIVHPRNRKTKYSLLDEVRKLYGKVANITHRIDKETSGLLLVSKNRSTEKILKTSFENKLVKKGYFALVRGKIDKELIIDEPIKKNRDFSKIRLKVVISDDGKSAQTIIRPLQYFKDIDATLVEAIPLTGRQHQIRIHLFHVKHPIIGDPIYGVDTNTAIKYLDKKLTIDERKKYTGAERLMLHANYLEFRYKKTVFKIYSKFDFMSEVERILKDKRQRD